jgi:hypothetical protein
VRDWTAAVSGKDASTTRALPSERRLAELLHKWTGIRLDGKEQLVTGRLTPQLLDLGLERCRD